MLNVPIFKGRRVRPPLVYHNGHERTCRVHQPEGGSESLAWVVSNALFTYLQFNPIYLLIPGLAFCH